MGLFRPSRLNAVFLASVLSAAAPKASAQGCDHHDADSPEERAEARRTIFWRHRDFHLHKVERVRLLSINDFHGQIGAGKSVSGRPVGSAPVLAAYLEEAADSLPGRTFLVHAGDHVGASPPNSALLQDEPSISFLNLMGNRFCTVHARENPLCDIVGTPGNHEFDEGKGELQRLLYGGNHAQGPFLENPWRGAAYPMISANVFKAGSDRTLLPPFNIKLAKGIPVAFIGAVLKETPAIVTPTGVTGLEFRDEAESINRQVAKLRRLGVRAMVVLIHQGGSQRSYPGETRDSASPVAGGIQRIIDDLDDEIDVVVSGHTHQFTNAFVKNKHGKTMLLTQAFSSGTAFGQIDLDLDRSTRDVVGMRGRIITTWADEGPGLTPDPRVRALVEQADARVAPLVDRIVGTAAHDILRAQNAAGESPLGDLIADAQRASVDADMAFMNPGGIRSDLSAGPITWGDLFTIQPFANDVVRMRLTGAQIYALLNQQWAGQASPRMLQISGLTYTWDDALPEGSKVVEVRRGGAPIGLADSFTIACNSFLAAGGDNFLVLKDGTERVVGPVDLAALADFIASRTQPSWLAWPVSPQWRMTARNGACPPDMGTATRCRLGRAPIT
jgi:5'-nucleotidase